MTYDHHIFVDFENVREADLDLLEGRPIALTLVLGKHQKALSLTMVEALRRLPPEQVTLVQSALSGKNALDFVLACLVGRVVERQAGIAVHVVSKDKGFDALIAHLKERDVQAARYESFTQVPGFKPRASGKAPKPAPKSAAKPPPPPPPAKKEAKKKEELSLEERVASLESRLLKANHVPRPRRRSTLGGYIKNHFGAKLTAMQVEETIEELIRRGVVAVLPSGELEYGGAGNGGSGGKTVVEDEDDEPLPF